MWHENGVDELFETQDKNQRVGQEVFETRKPLDYSNRGRGYTAKQRPIYPDIQPDPRSPKV